VGVSENIIIFEIHPPNYGWLESFCTKPQNQVESLRQKELLFKNIFFSAEVYVPPEAVVKSAIAAS